MNKFDFVGTLASIRPAATFLRLHHYRNELGEVADYNIVFHINLLLLSVTCIKYITKITEKYTSSYEK